MSNATDGWINPKVSMPEAGKLVLLAVQEEGVDGLDYDLGYFDDGWAAACNEWCFLDENDSSEVVAWMFLPKLPRQNAKLRDELDLCLKHVTKCEECEAMFNCAECEAMLDCDECLRADASQKERKQLDYENTKLRKLVRDMAAEIRGLGVDFKRVGWCNYADRMHELGIEINE